jgi:hypothetical protein
LKCCHHIKEKKKKKEILISWEKKISKVRRVPLSFFLVPYRQRRKTWGNNFFLFPVYPKSKLFFLYFIRRSERERERKVSIIDYFLSIYLLFFIIWIFSSVCDVGLCGLPRQENKFQIPMILLCNSNFFLCVVVVVLRRVDIQITWTQICHPHRPLERDLCNLWPVDTKLGNCRGRKFASSFFFLFNAV